MKKRKLLKEVNKIAKASKANLVFVREGGSHEVWAIEGQRFTIPRHGEINEHTAKGIIETVRKAKP